MLAEVQEGNAKKKGFSHFSLILFTKMLQERPCNHPQTTDSLLTSKSRMNWPLKQCHQWGSNLEH